MYKVFTYSLLMILGIALSQAVDLTPISPLLKFVTIVALGYIMIEVGLEFTFDKSKLKSYGKDYLIAMTAAAFPWILCSLYFWSCFDIDLTKAAIVGRFAAPTSAGVLFAMLAAAGLASTWVFKKARILAIFDDLDTVLLIVPLQMIHLGFDVRAILLLVIIIALLYIAYRYLHAFKLPTSRPWILAYAIALTLATEMFEKSTFISVEIILPAFVLGCILVNPHNPKRSLFHRREHAFIQPEKRWERVFDDTLKLCYMLLVGCSLPKISLGATSIAFLTFHVLALTFLANLGKLYPMLCYKKEASFRERAALSVAMWPRGEVGAGILIISMNYALPPVVIQLAQLSLALNLTLTGAFIYFVIWILKKPRMI
ncbi:MAG: cation:proton antiporter [Verrucomicrobia bacterium]|nr:cation:proton antiporter [Verrucomicrobiota bacterium]